MDLGYERQWRYRWTVGRSLERARSHGLLESAASTISSDVGPHMAQIEDRVAKRSFDWPRPCKFTKHVGYL